jgi:High potential iron-sulfur protein
MVSLAFRALPFQECYMNSSRRVFVIRSATTVAAGVAAVAAPMAFAQKPALVDPKDPTAVALGYVADGKADKAKFPKFEATQNCANCAIYQGKAGDASGGCPLFAGKPVPAKAWCSAWAKKAA